MSLARFISESLVRKACEKLSPHLGPSRTIYDRNGISPYLTRSYLLGRRSNDDETVTSRRSVNLYLHHFHRGDDDAALHSHPWRWSIAFILAGGYSEERRVGDGVIRRFVLPFRFNVIRADDYHRVDLLAPSTWTLFLAGPRVDTWYFWDRETKLRAKWDLYIDWLRGKNDGKDMWEYDSRSHVPDSELRRIAGQR